MTSRENTKSGCFSGVFRRLLCSGSLQTHPSDHIPELETLGFDDIKLEEKSNRVKVAKVQAVGGGGGGGGAAAAAPGVVARLMGLESLPQSNWVPRGKAPDLVTRSRSVNFMDYLLEFNLSDAQHRGVRTSVSFREVPPSLNQQKHDFLFFYLDKSDGTKEMGSKSRKSEMSFEELKQGKAERNKNKEINKSSKLVVNKKENQGNKTEKVSKLENEARRVYYKSSGNCRGTKVSAFVSRRKKDVHAKSGSTSMVKSPLKPMNQKEVLLERKFTRRRRNQLKLKEVEPETSSETSSPVSVLDQDEFLFYDDSYLPDPALCTRIQTEDSESMDLISKKKSSPRVITREDCPPPNSSLELTTTKQKGQYQSVDNQKTEYFMELVGMLCRLTEQDIKESQWIANRAFKLEDFEEFCMDFDREILDQILHQLVDELVGLDLENVTCNA